MTEHKITWYVYAGRERIRHTAQMRGRWAYDATCSCGWDSRTGGGVRRWVQELVKDHKDNACPNGEEHVWRLGPFAGSLKCVQCDELLT